MTSLAYPENLQAGFPGIFLNFFRVAVIFGRFFTLHQRLIYATLTLFPWFYTIYSTSLEASKQRPGSVNAASKSVKKIEKKFLRIFFSYKDFYPIVDD